MPSPVDSMTPTQPSPASALRRDPGGLVLCVGMAVVDILVSGFAPPRPGATTFVDQIAFAGGGDAFNQAMALARLGHRVSLATRVGDDEQGKLILEGAAAAGIATSASAVTGRPSVTTVALIGSDAERSFLTEHGVAEEFPAVPLLNAITEQHPAVVSIGSLCWSRDLDETVLPEALSAARGVGAFTIADFVNDREVDLESLSGLLSQLDCVVPSFEEAAQLTGTYDLDKIALRFREAGAGNVVIKLGSKGSIGYFGEEVIEMPALPVQAVDTTGAGDNFVAGFISGLLHGDDWRSALRFGAATGALSTLAVGAGAGYSCRTDVERFLPSV